MGDSHIKDWFSSAQTTTTGTGSASTPGVRSTNILYIGSTTGRKLGTGTPLYIEILVATTLASSGSNDAMDVWLASDDAEAFNTPATLHGVIATFPAVSAAGTRKIAVIPPELALGKYIGLYYISQTTDAFSAGAMTARILAANHQDGYTSYPLGYVVG